MKPRKGVMCENLLCHNIRHAIKFNFIILNINYNKLNNNYESANAIPLNESFNRGIYIYLHRSTNYYSVKKYQYLLFI